MVCQGLDTDYIIFQCDELISSCHPINIYLLLELPRQIRTVCSHSLQLCDALHVQVQSTTRRVLLLCSFIVLASNKNQRGEMSLVFWNHPKWRSYGLVKDQKISKHDEKRKKNGNSSQNCPWLMSSVFQRFNIGFYLAQMLISDQPLLDLHCNTVQLRPARCLPEQHIALSHCQRY